jgi:iron complex transport system substrate-binding protein
LALLLALAAIVLIASCAVPSAPAATPAAATAASAPQQEATPSPAIAPSATAVPASQATATSVPVSSPAPATGTSQSGFPITITDAVGRTVTVKSVPQKIVSLTPAHTETLFALGLADRIVGVDEYSNYPKEAQSKPKVGAYAQISVEKVVSLEPDLVLADTLHKTVVPELEKQGLTVVVLMPGSVKEVLKSISTTGALTGQVKEADALVAQLSKRVSAVEEKVKGASEKPRAFYELDETLFTAGPGSFVDDLMTRAGGSNVAADSGTEWPQLTLEVLVAKDPQVILLADSDAGQTEDTVKARPGWGSISAVKQGRIVAINPDVCSRPGPRLADGIEQLARAIHPELFQ